MKLSKKISGAQPIILYEPYFEPYSILLGHLPYKFILYNHQQSRKWNFNYGQIPANHISINTIVPNLSPDIVICQGHKNIDFYRKLQDKFQCKLIGIEYDIPKVNEHEIYYNEVDEYVYLSERHRDIWWGPSSVSKIIPFCAQPAKKAENNIYVCPSNEFMNLFDIVHNMAKGNCVISQASFEAPYIIDHFRNGILFNDELTKKQIVEKLKTNKDVVESIGNGALQKIKTQFNIEQFKSKWMALINECITKN